MTEQQARDFVENRGYTIVGTIQPCGDGYRAKTTQGVVYVCDDGWGIRFIDGTYLTSRTCTQL